ncbi:hypothetical protein ANCCAN_03641 [Ancylostoma caninum]|uniref:Uncharacterized protein n=1 Tax=Ancylostoma caninum TaxID=29170 RepID=A0A368H0V8_ANCCA|nr:hypothetical protein ANCCAN_03641 [Ancylostoma caninum]
MLILNADIRRKVLRLLGHKNSGDVQDGPVFTMRIVFPIISCFLSYVNAWLMLILNADIRRKVLRLLGHKNSSNVQVTVVISQTRKASSVGDMQRAYSLCSSERPNERN